MHKCSRSHDVRNFVLLLPFVTALLRLVSRYVALPHFTYISSKGAYGFDTFPENVSGY